MVELPLHPADGRRRGGEGEGGRGERREEEGGEEEGGGGRRGRREEEGGEEEGGEGREERKGVETHLGKTEKAKDSLQSKEQNNCDEETDDGNAEPNFGDNLQW